MTYKQAPPTSLRIRPDLKEMIDDYARDSNTPRNQLINQAIEDWVNRLTGVTQAKAPISD